MEPLTVAAATGLVMNYLLPAIRDLGQNVLESAEDSASNEVVGFGKQLLHLLLSRKSKADPTGSDVAILRKGIERRVRTLTDGPAQQKTVGQLEGTIEDLLMADPDLLPAITELLAKAPRAVFNQEGHSVHVGHDNFGNVVSGDGNTVVNRSRRG
jgi:hypothetical protein